MAMCHHTTSQLLPLLPVAVVKGIFYHSKIRTWPTSPVNEQVNAGLSKPRPSLAYMRQDNFHVTHRIIPGAEEHPLEEQL